MAIWVEPTAKEKKKTWKISAGIKTQWIVETMRKKQPRRKKNMPNHILFLMKIHDIRCTNDADPGGMNLDER